MGLDVWFQTDVARLLAATQEAMTATMNATATRDLDQTEAYGQGFNDAIRAVAVAFGVTVPSSLSSLQPTNRLQPPPYCRQMPRGWEEG